MSLELVEGRWGEAIDAPLREHLPELEIVSIPRGLSQVFRCVRMCSSPSR